MNKSVILLSKPVSTTPFQTIQYYRQKHPEYQSIKLGYAGRLDPMAEGLLLVLIGDENKRRKHYEELPKTYEFSVLFGFTSDSYDLLGIPNIHIHSPWTKQDDDAMYRYMETIKGKQQQAFPPFSSKPVEGKPLYKWAREGRLHEIDIPSHMVEIFTFEKHKARSVKGKVLQEIVHKKIDPIEGNFRQKEILKAWDIILRDHTEREFYLSDFSVTCSSGTYIRGIAHEMGKMLNRGAIALSIKRTAIGDYSLNNAEPTKKPH